MFSPIHRKGDFTPGTPKAFQVSRVKRGDYPSIVYLGAKDPSASFYFPQTRFWELSIGGLTAVLIRHINPGSPASKKQSLLSIAGLALLLYGFIRIPNASSFPGTWALIPVMSTALIIFSGAQSIINRVILSNPILVWIGLISFPIYLWHWPLLSFARIICGEVP